MLPISNPKQAARPSLSRARPEGEVAGKAPQPGGHGAPLCSTNEPLRPIGKDRLKALRDAIEDGSYPTEADVLGGLERLFEVDDDE